MGLNRWHLLLALVAVVLGGMVWLQNDTINGYRVALKNAQASVVEAEQKTQRALAQLQSYSSLEEGYAKWKAAQDASNKAQLAALRNALAGNVCAGEPVPVDALRLQREKASAIRTRAGVPATAE